eukprot:scaffold51083_cov40-Prasinocladus_malaysianus.AAC.1
MPSPEFGLSADFADGYPSTSARTAELDLGAAGIQIKIQVPQMVWTGKVPMICQIHGCDVDLAREGIRNARVRTCQQHQEASVIYMRDGPPHRFCLQCMRLHPLDRFESNKRSCKERLQRQKNRCGPHPQFHVHVELIFARDVLENGARAGVNCAAVFISRNGARWQTAQQWPRFPPQGYFRIG